MRSRQNLWGGVCRGAAIGAIVGLTIWLILACVLAVLFVNVPQLRQGLWAQYQGRSTLAIIGDFLATIGVLMLYGALPCAVFMGIVGMFRANRDKAPDSN